MDFDEYIAAREEMTQKAARKAELDKDQARKLKLMEAFGTLDKNGDGTLTLDDIKQVHAEHNLPLPDNFSEIFASHDTDGSGSMDFDEYIAAQEMTGKGDSKGKGKGKGKGDSKGKGK